MPPRRVTHTGNESSPIHWDLGVAMLSAYDDDGWLGVQPDALGENASGVKPYEVHNPGGIVHRPLDPVVDPVSLLPDESQAAQLFVGLRGRLGVVLVLGDPRVVPELPQLQKGETSVYGDAGQFERFHADGSISRYTTTDGGKSTGQTIVEWLTPTQRDFSAPWGRETFDAMGYRLTAINGGQAIASITMGGASGLPPGLDGYMTLQAPMIELDGNVTIGPTGMPQLGVLQAIPTAVALATLTAAINSIITAMGGVTGGAAFPGLPAATAAAAAAATAIASVAKPTTAGGCATQTALA